MGDKVGAEAERLLWELPAVRVEQHERAFRNERDRVGEVVPAGKKAREKKNRRWGDEVQSSTRARESAREKRDDNAGMRTDKTANCWPTTHKVRHGGKSGHVCVCFFFGVGVFFGCIRTPR